MAARIRKTRITEDWKARIRVGHILDRLHKHGDSILELSSTQIKAYEILLRKSLPDLTASDNKHDVQLVTRKMTPEEEKKAKEILLRYAITHGGA